MSGISNSKSKSDGLVWEDLNDSGRLEELLADEGYVLFFKHSTRCGTSTMALNRFEKEWSNKKKCKLVYLDLIKYRSLSDEIAMRTGIRHESPQVILLYKGKTIYNESHSGISTGQIENLIEIE